MEVGDLLQMQAQVEGELSPPTNEEMSALSPEERAGL